MNRKILEKKLLSMVEEDQGAGDVTGQLVEDQRVKAEIVAGECCHISGVYELKILFSLFDIDVLSSAKDGDKVSPEQRVFILSGGARSMLLVERTALNILSRMTGITSLTKDYLVEACKGNPKVRIAATRKTTPMFGYFEKKAVSVGGGDTHRMGLYDMVLLKDNHLRLFKDVREAVKIAREKTSFSHKIEIEVSSVSDAVAAAEAGADIVMLDNMKPAEVDRAVKALSESKLRDRVVVEASGGVTLENVSLFAAAGVDVVSVGRLTHSAAAKDFSLTFL